MIFLNEIFGQIPIHSVIIMRHYFYFVCVCEYIACMPWHMSAGQRTSSDVNLCSLFHWDRVSLVVSPCVCRTSWPTSSRDFSLCRAPCGNMDQRIQRETRRCVLYWWFFFGFWRIQTQVLTLAQQILYPPSHLPSPAPPPPVYSLFLQGCTGPPGLCESSQWAWSQGLFVHETSTLRDM